MIIKLGVVFCCLLGLYNLLSSRDEEEEEGLHEAQRLLENEAWKQRERVAQHRFKMEKELEERRRKEKEDREVRLCAMLSSIIQLIVQRDVVFAEIEMGTYRVSTRMKLVSIATNKDPH